MSNYSMEEIAASIAAKAGEEEGLRKTPRKGSTTKTTFSFHYLKDGVEKKCVKFSHGHSVNGEGRVCLAANKENAPPQLTLANDSRADHELAKLSLVPWLTTPDGAAKLQVIKDNPPSNQPTRRALTAAVKQSLAEMFDVGQSFIDDKKCFPWDLQKFRLTALAYKTVFGEGACHSLLCDMVSRTLSHLVF
jgi:hypothetical protein